MLAFTRALCCTLLLAIAMAMLPKLAAAHPHAWIDLRSTVLLDENGHIVAIEQEWLFDEFYTVFVAEHMESTGDEEAAALSELAEANLENLRPHNYFTEVKLDGSLVATETVTEYDTELRNGRLWLRFVLPIANPVDASTKAFSFAVFDPTYYVEILHLEGEVVAFGGQTENGCFGLIVPPTPSPEMVMLAQALDRDAKPDNTLGSMFAERVEVTCQD